MDRWLFRWRRLRRELWFRASLYALLGVAAALLAVVAAPLVPQAMADRLGGDSANSILTILASSLLAVATFSLGAMVTAYTSMSAAASPRVASLVTSDEGSQKALSTFVGAFLYSVVAVTAINAGYYGTKGRSILFLVSAFVVLVVALRLLAWIERLSRLATISHIVEKVEALVRESLDQRRLTSLAAPDPERGVHGVEVAAGRTGHVQNIALDRLQGLAEDLDCRVELLVAPGAFVLTGQPVLRTDLTECPEGRLADLRHAIEIGDGRSYEQDPRFGLIVLGEIAGKALSPGVNDPGTAISVIRAATRVLDDWSRADTGQIGHDRLTALPLAASDLLDDVFTPIARDGAGDLAVAVALQQALSALRAGPADVAACAERLAASGLARSRRAMTDPDDLRRVEEARRNVVRRIA
ncbi:DUF2254 domain-containing protein [Aeromicrobium sp. A1-2]|uniref:DUF2254 domain-containing protein n=1 Tax=Aeromicrobium sp. A1-2 TaxID=2107713 RepID=UPI000E49B301|nr:DUF2254 domain-containing protein [Aeromicrobium sp. A1-2]AXT85903.1 DUF2254 domain-containing protein [Aeromicrobium sp. A1-2]